MAATTHHVASASPLNETHFFLNGVDHDSPMVHTNSYLIYKDVLRPGVTKESVTEAHIAGLEQTVQDLPLLAASAARDAAGVLCYQIKKHATVQFDVADLQDDPEIPSVPELEQQGFSPDRLDPSKFEAYGMGHFADGQNAQVDSPAAFAKLCFVRGGVILSLGVSHKLADAGSTDLWAKAWAHHTRAALAQQTPERFAIKTDRSWFTPQLLTDDAFDEHRQRFADIFQVTEPSAPLNMWWLGQRPQSRTVRFSPTAIARLKAEFAPADGFVSAFDCLSAVAGQAMTRCRAQDPRYAALPTVRLVFANSLRKKEPLVGSRYFGNCFASALIGPTPVANVLAPGGAKTLARQSRQAIERSMLPYFQAVYDLKHTAESKGLITQVAPRIADGLDGIITSWNAMELDAYDFGFGECLAVRTGPILLTGVAAFWPSSTKQLATIGIHVTFFMEEEHWPALLADEELLKHAEFVN